MKTTQIRVRLREDLEKRLRDAAAKSGHSFNDEIVTRLINSFTAADTLLAHQRRQEQLVDMLNIALRNISQPRKGE
jgi:hypothetical protein